MSMPTKAAAVLGLLIWAGWLLRSPRYDIAILLYAALVLIPLATWWVTEHCGGSRSLGLVRWMQLPAGVCLLVSTEVGRGDLSAGLSVPWLVLTLLMAVDGVLRLVRSYGSLDEATVAVGQLFLPVAGLHAAAYAGGWRPLGFPDGIILLTAIHFHYAGFFLPLLAASSHLRSGRFAIVRNGLILGGVPLVGIGIAGSPTIELAGVIALCLGCWLLVISQISGETFARVLPAGLTIGSALALAAGMVLALLYGIGEWTGSQSLSIPWMIRVHGSLNAFGFATCGILALIWGEANEGFAATKKKSATETDGGLS